MARVTISEKYCTVNPLKMSPSIGAALAFLGVDNSMPLAAWVAGLHLLRACLVRASFPRGDSDADDGDERGRHCSGRFRQSGTGVGEYRRAHPSDVDRNLHDRNLRD
jgi:hypothetical protein